MIAVVVERDIIQQLRRLMPERRLTWVEAGSIAERQATRLLAYARITEPHVPSFIISSLPGISVERLADWPTSGMTAQAAWGWRIVLSASESVRRQRFSLAHEFKHILDDPLVDCLYEHLPEDARHARSERLANTFAACLLMPRAWIKRDWCAGHQTLDQLTRRYAVSEEAMAIRLAEVGLYHPIRRIA